jgi:hypothetical protein
MATSTVTGQFLSDVHRPIADKVGCPRFANRCIRIGGIPEKRAKTFLLAISIMAIIIDYAVSSCFLVSVSSYLFLLILFLQFICYNVVDSQLKLVACHSRNALGS